MKNLLKKLHVMSNTNNQGGDNEGSNSSRNSKLNVWPSPRSQHDSEHKPLSALTDWFQQVTNKKSPSPPSSSNVKKDEGMELSEPAPTSGGGMDAIIDAAKPDLEPTIPTDPGVEEYQIQLAMEMSAREDPEAVQIEAVKQISLGSCPPENTPAEVVAYRYWSHNSLGYDDKILDGFYDLYGILTEDTSSKMPSLIDLQGAEVSTGITWEAVLVNRASDANLLKLEQKALVLAVKARSKSFLSVDRELVREIASLVSDYMGGPVTDPNNMLRAWKSLSYSLKSTLGSMVLPLGSLTIGLARHRALLFKVLADSVGIPCQLVKGKQYTGSDDVAMNMVKVNDGREFIVDLMGDPGSLIPSDAAGTRLEYEECVPFPNPLSGYTDSSNVGPSSSGMVASFAKPPHVQDQRTVPKKQVARGSEPGEGCISTSSKQGFSTRPSYISHARSPSWTEGISSPAVGKMKVKDVSQYMIDAAKENPQLAQKLHDVLLESGVVAPANLFSEIYHGETDVSIDDTRPHIENRDEFRRRPKPGGLKVHGDPGRPNFLPPLPHRGEPPRSTSIPQQENAMETDASLLPLPLPQPQNLKPAEAPTVDRNPDLHELRGHPSLLQPDVTHVNFGKNVPVTAAAVAAAAIVASSIVAAAKSSTESIELPVAAAATATAAAVVATTAAVGKQYEHLDSSSHSSGGAAANQIDGTRSDGDTDSAGREPQGSGKKEHDAIGTNSEVDRVSDRSAGTESVKSDATLDDVADCEILWEDISLGERIGLGSYGEVYRGDWRGTEVAVKRFLDQDVYGESLEEFRSEVHIMKKVRHPNVVLFMGAVTRPPYLSIVTEFLHRGSLYRLLHRPNNQLDERRRLRMALDAARGMNYLHSCSPVIVHRDLKSPNLLVDRNWVVKVCDFGLSRMKHSTFLSSRSTAGTAEWMAPEVLRNEPSDEKCDVYSYGVILWELCTLQQPWGGMNPMQVVGAVGFQHRRLDIPDDIDPTVAQIIRKCWETDPKLRPTFAEIMAALKPLQKPVTGSHAQKSSISRGSKHIKAEQSHSKEEAEG